MVPVDVLELLREDLTHESKPREHLYPSSDLVGSLRHTQLAYVGAPRVISDLVSDMRMETGTMWHKKLGVLLENAGVPVMREVRLTPWMPEGWSGIADLLFFVPESRAWVLRDVKTTKGEGIKWKLEKGISLDHLWQVSSYWWACYNMGLRMMDQFEIMYLPMSQVIKEEVEPAIVAAKPVPEEQLVERMAERWLSVQEYKTSVENETGIAAESFAYLNEDQFVTSALAPIQPRVQKLVWDSKKQWWNVILVPHWSAAYCPYPESLCGCSLEGTTKVGHFLSETDKGDSRSISYVARSGYEGIEPENHPSKTEIRRRFSDGRGRTS